MAPADNKLSSIPPAVSQLSALETLALDNNDLKSLPVKELLSISSLSRVSVRGNPSLPSQQSAELSDALSLRPGGQLIIE